MALPAWEELHPMVVHFPVALLLVAPLLALIAVLVKKRRGFFAAALVVMSLGTVGAWVAVATGEEAAEDARLPEAAVERHGEMAETSRTLFTALTLVYAALVIAPWAMKREPDRLLELAAHGAFLAVYAAAAVYLAQAAHAGGLLVHQPGQAVRMETGTSSEGDRGHDD